MTHTRLEWGWGPSQLGVFLAARHQDAICWLSLGEGHDALTQEFQDTYGGLLVDEVALDSTPWLQKIQAMLNDQERGEDIPIELEGTAFQKQVWNALRDIPRGATQSYQDIADRLGKPTAARAVGTAIGQNRIAVLVPCHRVVRKDGGLSGFRWGVEIKRRLLRRESDQQSLNLEEL